MKLQTIYSLINFQTIKDIFDLSTINLSSKDKTLYINCLFGHFKDKEATVENLDSFVINIDSMKNYNTWKNNFENLHNAELIEVTKHKITFFNFWCNFINIDINTIEQDVYDDEIEKKLLENRSMIDVVGMKNKLNIEQIKHLIKIFVVEQKAIDAKHRDEGEYAKHFIYWVKTNIDNLGDHKQSFVKSNNKLLGI
jgi:hypothetical protein